ncbi:MAG TPA: alpha/beta hydrolase [Polyangiaceae bacterium]|jgi:pimeloyl-ACP methyl ester carboxylesterase
MPLLHHRVFGNGPPLVLLHGLTGTGDDWTHVFDLDTLARSFRLVLPDARGHGRSPNPTGDFTFRACAEDTLALLDHLGLERVRAIGVSLGAKTLLHLATLAPARLEAMVLVSATPRLCDTSRRVMRAAAAADHTADEWTLMRGKHPLGDDQIRALWALPARLAASTDDLDFTPERLVAIEARTLVVSGDRDPLYPVELALELHRGIPRSALFVLPGEGHGPIYGAWRETFAKTALDFLTRET